jgi:acetyl esterase/lipase
MEKDVPYVPGGDPAQILDVYFPDTPPASPRPLIVYIHGGGWRAGSKFPCPLLHMVEKGYIVASVEYRFSPKAVFPAQIQDCQAALRWLRARHREFHFNPDRVGVLGTSAGGHLCALLGTAGGKNLFPTLGPHPAESDRVQAVCDVFGPTDFSSVIRQAARDPNVRNVFQFNSPADPYSSLIGAPLDHPEKTRAVSPLFHVSPDCPPFLILHGTHDALVPIAQSATFAEALRAKGVPVWFQILPGSGHGGPAFTHPAIAKLTLQFFEKHLKDTGPAPELVPESEVAVPPIVPAPK